MSEAEKLETVEEPENGLVGSNFDHSVIKEAVRSAEVFFQLFSEDVKKREQDS